MPKIQFLFHFIFIRSWWVIAFAFVCLIFYEQELKKREYLSLKLTKQLNFWQAEKKRALKQQKNLESQINSQSDLAWVELTLMKGLGLAAEDQQKVYFYPKDDKGTTPDLRIGD